jgi:hypothetical protein
MCIRAVSPWSRCQTRIATLAALAVVALFALAGSAQAAAPGNDDFANALTITGASGTQSGSTLEATTQSGEPNNHEAEVGQTNDLGTASVWYEWTAPASGLVGFQTEDPGTDYDTTLGVYTGSLGSLNEVDYNDDYGSTTRQSRVVFNASAGQTYKLAVGGYSNLSGAFTLKWDAATRPANDAFASAVPIAGSSGTQAGSNFDASEEPGELKNHFPVSDLGADSVWYTWTAPTSGRYAFTAPGTPWNENPDEPFFAVVGGYTADLSGLNEVGFGRALGFQATAGTTYAIAVGGDHGDALNHAYWGDMGSFTLTWVEDNVAPETTITSSSGGKHSITYAFTGSDNHSSFANLRFECKLDSGSFESCGKNPKTISPIAGGLHTVQVRAIDEAGNVDPSPAVKQIRAKGGAKAAAATAARAKKKGHSAKRKSHLKKKAYRLSSRR